ncbi:unnamed protein product [Mycena citricolor]|uniref:Peptidase S28 n=1 Tax=Mycena citricolor TaxID=2018698 RepID=A0AAD2K821_9AGAR|nr:unnamed protein product [Mycena citricolor]
MKMLLGTVLLALSVHAAENFEHLQRLGPQGINLYRLEKQAAAAAKSAKSRFTVQGAARYGFSDGAEEQISAEFKAQWFEQPLDHFDKSNNATFLQRYWINTRHYDPKKPGPVYVLDGGETSGVNRITFLDTGIMEILPRATGGVGIVLEHRYYGKSIPVSNFSTDNLRWLNNAQSAADSANFIANVKFEGIEEDLTAPNTPWIYYGGSYAGARAAHMKVLYPDLVYGAISSSGVTHADYLNWEYHEIIRNAADPVCMEHLENSIQTIDAILATGRLSHPLKSLFGLGGLTFDDDFASVISTPLGSWQSKYWHPDFVSTRFDEFCEALNAPPFGSGPSSLSALPYNSAERMVSVPGGLELDWTILNYAKYIKENVVSRCPEELDLDDCFGTHDEEQYLAADLDQDWRLWLFQVCTEWGYFFTAPPDPEHPRIVSNLQTLDYATKTCAQAFPPGKHMMVPPMPNITVVNELGDFGIAADRLAIIDGDIDPWRPMTPHSDNAFDRPDTVLQPFKIIRNGVHHYDEWGLMNLDDEPEEVRKIHEEMIYFVKEWLKDWQAPKSV